MKHALASVIASIVMQCALAQQPYESTVQGFSVHTRLDNRGVLGAQSDEYSSIDSIGCEYPPGSRCEHLFGGGLWCGGILDLSSIGGGRQRLVSSTYEGWIGPLYEFSPGTQPPDTIWKIQGRSWPKPAGWDAYWGNALAYDPRSDNDFYCRYSDHSHQITGHTPLTLDVTQSSFVWNEPYAEGIQIIRYTIVNAGEFPIDSAYLAWFAEMDIGPISTPNYASRNFAASVPSLHMAYVHNPVDLGSTPLGVALLAAPLPWDSLRFTFQWFNGPESPTTDAERYALISSGTIRPDEFPTLSDTRFVLGVGPFRIRPRTDPHPDTLTFAIGLIAGQSTANLQDRTARAAALYTSRILTGVLPFEAPIPERFSLVQNYPNPFNPITNIEFRVKKEAFVTLTVFDMLGREVATLVQERLAPGTYRRSFDGSGLSSGVYLCRMEAAGFVRSIRMMLIK